MAKMYMTKQSSIWKVETLEGVFTVYFPCGVYNSDDKFLDIPKTIRDFRFLPMPECPTCTEQDKINSLNKASLQNALCRALCFGTSTPQGRLSLDWEGKRVYVM